MRTEKYYHWTNEQMKKISQHVVFCKKILYFSPEEEVMLKTIGALFIHSTQRFQASLHLLNHSYSPRKHYVNGLYHITADL